MIFRAVLIPAYISTPLSHIARSGLVASAWPEGGAGYTIAKNNNLEAGTFE